MFRRPLLWTIRALALCGIIFSFASTASAEWKENVLYNFQGNPNDGTGPYAGVVFDKAGNLYGTTGWGGGTSCGGPAECGIVFQLQPPKQKSGTWTENILYTFKGEPYKDGDTPQGGLIIDDAGNLYGTTAYGGAGPCLLFGTPVGCGTVFEMSPPAQQGGAWTYAILYSFQGNKDGHYPQGNLTFDKHGNLYGATQFGGGRGYNNCNKFYGYCGTIFKLSPPKQKGGTWTEKVLYSFAGVKNGAIGDGAEPNGGLIFDSKGAIYGTTYFGGGSQGECNGGSGGTGCGTVFKLDPPTKKGGAWSKTIPYRFNGPDGASPTAGLIFDEDGNLYGTASGGGEGYGVVFRLAKPSRRSHSWAEAVLYRFQDGADGAIPQQANFISDAQGNLYSTVGAGHQTYGNVFEMKGPARKGGAWTFAILYSLKGAPDGANPVAGLVFDKSGNLYGTTLKGGTGNGSDCSYGCGTVFEVEP
jgi:hypothetical protein